MKKTTIEKLIDAILQDDAATVDNLLTNDFSQDKDTIRESLTIAIDNSSLKSLPIITKHCKLDSSLVNTYKALLATDNPLQYIEIFRRQPKVLSDRVFYSQLSIEEKTKALSMIYELATDSLKNETDILKNFIDDLDDGIALALFFANDKKAFQNASAYMKILVLEVILEDEVLAEHVPYVLEVLHDTDHLKEENCPVEKKGRFIHYTGADYWLCKGDSKSVESALKNAIYKSSKKRVSTTYDIYLPLIKRHTSSALYKNLKAMSDDNVISQSLFSSAGVDIALEHINNGFSGSINMALISHVKKKMLNKNTLLPDDEIFNYANQIAEALREKYQQSPEDESQKIVHEISSLIHDLVDEGKLLHTNIATLVPVLNLLFTNTAPPTDLLPDKRKSPIMSDIANLETSKWAALAYYKIAKSYPLKEFVYAYTPEGIKNTDLALEIIRLYQITPYDAIQILDDEYSGEQLIQLI